MGWLLLAMFTIPCLYALGRGVVVLKNRNRAVRKAAGKGRDGG